MKRLAITTILVIMIFLTGCIPGYSEYKAYKAQKQAEQQLEQVQEQMKDFQAAQEQMRRTTTTTTSTRTTTDDVDEEEDRVISIRDEETGEGFGIRKLEDTSRTKSTVEVCNLDYPAECVKYQGVDGIVYLTVKNTGYGSKMAEVTLYLDGDECDPAGTYIEPGQNKDFECYVDPYVSYASGDLELDYMIPEPDKYFTTTGRLNVKME